MKLFEIHSLIQCNQLICHVEWVTLFAHELFRAKKMLHFLSVETGQTFYCHTFWCCTTLLQVLVTNLPCCYEILIINANPFSNEDAFLKKTFNSYMCHSFFCGFCQSKGRPEVKEM